MTARAIVAIDVPGAKQAAELLAQLGPEADFVKVGSELFTAAGPELVTRLRAQRREVFLDIKWHDIPTTVRNAARVAAKLDVRLVTAHASGGRAMLDAAVEGAGNSCGVLAVTVLTSLDAASLGEAWGRPIARVLDEVMRLAELARAAGAHGIVCSGAEAAAVRAAYGDALHLLIPGIRMKGGDANDQARVVTPEEAIAAGASYLVLGRVVTGAPDPREALTSVRRAMRV